MVTGGPRSLPPAHDLHRARRHRRQCGALHCVYADVEPRLRRALMAAYGPDTGREATAAALAWAWEHGGHVTVMDHPHGYLYGVGRSSVGWRRSRILHARDDWSEPWIGPELASGLARLSRNQRIAVVVVHDYSWTVAGVAVRLGVNVATVQNHLERGLTRLRSHLGVQPDA